MAWTDYLTGLPNRARLMAALEAARVGTGRGEPACVLLIDLDGFKAVNDVAGHEAGDLLLADVADRLRAAARDRDLVARLGGDEFALVVPARRRRRRPRWPSGCCVLLDRPVPGARPRRRRGRGPVFAVSGSIGVAQLVPDEDAAAAIRAADLALRARQGGRQELRPVHRPRPGRRARRRDAPARAAGARPAGRPRARPAAAGVPARRRAWPSGGCSGSRRWCAGTTRCSAPCRPTSSSRLAEDDGLIVPLQQWVLRDGDRRPRRAPRPRAATSRWASTSRCATCRPAAWPRTSPARCAAAGVPPQRLMLEVTETRAHRRRRAARGRPRRRCATWAASSASTTSARASRRWPTWPGCRSTSSRWTASSWPASTATRGAAALVRTVVDIGRRLGIDVVAEGVETPGPAGRAARARAATSSRAGCIGRPVPPTGCADADRRLRPAPVLDGRPTRARAVPCTLADVH